MKLVDNGRGGCELFFLASRTVDFRIIYATQGEFNEVQDILGLYIVKD